MARLQYYNNKYVRTKVTVKDYENINQSLRRLKKKVQESGKLEALRKKEFYMKPTTERKRAKGVAISRYKKKLAKESLPHLNRKF